MRTTMKALLGKMKEWELQALRVPAKFDGELSDD